MKLSRDRYVSAYDIAIIHVSLGNSNEAFAWLDKAIEERAMPLVVLRFDPAFDQIRDDPRMTSVMARLNCIGRPCEQPALTSRAAGMHCPPSS
jgi:hypothetical protein